MYLLHFRYNGNLPPDNLSRNNLLLFKKATTCRATTCRPTNLSPVNLSPQQIVTKFYNIEPLLKIELTTPT
jgi:hypothetical protein